MTPESTKRRTRQEGAQAALTAVGSTIVVFGVIGWAVVSSPNWPAVQQQFFSRQVFIDSIPRVASGFWVNVQLFAIAMITIPITALLVTLMRSFRGPGFAPLRLLAVIYTDVLRGIPLILLILMLGFGVPALGIPGLTNSVWFWGLVALTLSYSAYTAEIYRSGIEAVAESQRASARALGLTQWQTMRYAVLPQALRNVVPALMNTVVSLQKDVSLISILGVRDAVREAQLISSRTFNFTPYLVATALFLAFSIPLTRFVDWYTRRDRARRTQAAV